ncbi:MAG: hypothetical protein P8Q48_07080 [Paracoccaceae bacterium]|nr:hypothetical protein [Paracoccaceae bacterium]MDG1369990.1 hypothetical protein [Paracoccaceae bacterium]
MLNQFFITKAFEVLDPYIHRDGDRRHHNEKHQSQRRRDVLQTKFAQIVGARQSREKQGDMENAKRSVEDRATLLGKRNKICRSDTATCEDAQAPTFRRHYIHQRQANAACNRQAVRQLPNWFFDMRKRGFGVLRSFVNSSEDN